MKGEKRYECDEERGPSRGGFKQMRADKEVPKIREGGNKDYTMDHMNTHP